MNWDLSFLFSIRGVLAGIASIFVIIQILRSPFFGLLFFLFLITVQPHQMELFPGIETFPTVKFFSIFIFLSIFFNHSKLKRDDNWFWSKHTLLILLFALFLSISGSFSKDAFDYFNERFIKVIIIYILITYLIRDEKEITKFFNVYIACITFITIYCLLGYHEFFGIDKLIERDRELDIDRLRYVGSMSGPNDFALFLVSSLPFTLTFFIKTPGRLNKVKYGLILLITLYAIRLTYSRGGFLALMIVMFMYGITSRRRWLVTGISFLLIGLFLISSDADYKWRILSINKTVEGEEIDESSLRRLELWKTGLNMFKAHPYTGIGMGQFAKYVFDYVPYDATIEKAQVAHNSFITVLAEIGIFGFLLYIFIIFNTFYTLYKTYKSTEDNILTVSSFSRPLLISISGILASGFFLTQSYNWMFYIFIALTHCIKKISENQSKVINV